MDGSGKKSFRDALFDAAFETTELARLADGLQGVIGLLCARVPELPAELMAECQAADLLSQRISGLAMFLALVAAGAPDHIRVELNAVAQALPLGDQARRLCGAEGSSAASPGELEVFDV
jgi:hypothetical protein